MKIVLLGTLINVVFIIVGSLIGLSLTAIKEEYKQIFTQVIALVVIIIGVQMSLTSENTIIVLLSLLTGAFIGQFFEIEERLNIFSERLSLRLAKTQSDNVLQGFITASLLYVVGAMAVLGALESGLHNEHNILMTKAFLDGFTSIVLTTTLGFSVILSALPVLIYQGTISLLATQITNYVPQAFLDGLLLELTGVGGVMILAIGLNMLNLTKIKIANLLPGVLTVIVIYLVYFIL